MPFSAWTDTEFRTHLHEKALGRSVESTVDVMSDQQHTFRMSAGYDRVADAAIARMADWVRPKLV